MAGWFYLVNDVQTGPVSTSKLRELAANGHLKPSDLIWREGIANWIQARQVQNIFPPSQPKPAARSAPPHRVESSSLKAPPTSPPPRIKSSAAATPVALQPRSLPEWHYVQNGVQHGPIAFDRLKELASTGRLRPTDFVSMVGTSTWQEASTVQGLCELSTTSMSQRPPAATFVPSADSRPSHSFATEENATLDCGSVITAFISSYAGERSANIWTGNGIPTNYLVAHKQKYLHLAGNERVLVLLNKGRMFGNAFTGLIITNTRIHYCTLKNSFFASLIPWFLRGPQGAKALAECKSIEIGEHDVCFGPAYVGHQLRIDDQVLGLVRMGTGTCLDDRAIAFLNGLFDHLADNHVLSRRVKQYAWQ